MTNWDIKVRIPDKIITKKCHGELLPDNIRCLIVGPSNCGKTTLMIDNFIYSPGWLNFGTLYVCSRGQRLAQW